MVDLLASVKLFYKNYDFPLCENDRFAPVKILCRNDKFAPL